MASYTKDELWKMIEDYLRIVLNSDRNPTIKEAMDAYSASVDLESRRYSDKGGNVYYRKPDGKRVHGVRIRTAKLIREYCENHSNETRESFLIKWQRASKIIFSYHDRHYVKRERDESASTSPNYETAMMFDFGMMVWDQYHGEHSTEESQNNLDP